MNTRLPDKPGLYSIRSTKLVTKGILWWTTTRIQEFDAGFLDVEKHGDKFITKFYSEFSDLLCEIHHTKYKILDVVNMNEACGLTSQVDAIYAFNDAMWKCIWLQKIDTL